MTEALLRIKVDPSLLGGKGAAVQREVATILAQVDQVPIDGSDVRACLEPALQILVADETERAKWIALLSQSVEVSGATTLSDLLAYISTSDEQIEQDQGEGQVSILTMHQAKGLTATAVFVIAAEDELIPGRAEGQQVGDERRLLYVSLTRAKNFLFVSYCDRRLDAQTHYGKSPGNPSHSLTTFLRGGPVVPQPGKTYIDRFLGSTGRAIT